MHLHLTDSFTGQLIVRTSGDDTITVTRKAAMPIGEALSAPTGVELPADVEAMVARHEARGVEGTRSREMAQALGERGWTLKAGPKYFRAIYTGATRKVTIYVNSRDLMCRDPRQFAESLPGAISGKNEVRWRYTGHDFDTAVAAADALRSMAGESGEPA